MGNTEFADPDKISYVSMFQRFLMISVDAAGEKISKRCLLLTSVLWSYIVLRIVCDLFPIYWEPETFDDYVETELLTDVSQIGSLTRVIIFIVATVDLTIDRIIISGSLLLVFFVYVFTNLVSSLQELRPEGTG